MPCSTVSEIHAYPLFPEGYEEPLFPSPESKREIAEHLLGAPWLCRASEVSRTAETSRWSGQSAHSLQESVEIIRCGGLVKVVRPRCFGVRLSSSSKRTWSKRTLERVLDLWREVGDWWDEGYVERTVFRVLLSGQRLSGETVVDLSRDAFGEWSLLGVVD